MQKKNTNAVVSGAEATHFPTHDLTRLEGMLTVSIGPDEMADVIDRCMETLLGYLLQDRSFHGGGTEGDDFYHMRELSKAIRAAEPEEVDA